MTSKTIKGFKVIPVQFSETNPAQHDLFVKEHTAHNQSSDKPVGRTLFVLNVPPYATEDSIKAAFLVAGPVKHVIFQSRLHSSTEPSANDETTEITGFKVAYVVYEHTSSINKALNLNTLKPLSTEERPIVTGVLKWTREYNDSILDHNKLQESIDKFMAKYDKEQVKLKQKEKQNDDGGWTVVTKKHRKHGHSRKESVEFKILEKNKKAEKRKHLDDFYVFQKREAKMQHIANIRKEFEQAKKKVEALKQARKFKPF